MKDIYYRLEYYFVCICAIVINSVSRSFSNRIANMIGSLLFLWKRRRRQISIDNIQAAFPQLTCEEVLNVGRRSMASRIKVVFELTRISLTRDKLEKIVEIQGEENVREALKLKKGLLLVVSHFGNWELMGLAAAANGLPVHAVGKPIENLYIYNYLQKLRVSTGMGTIDRKGAVKEIRRLLKQNQVVAMLVDERVKKGGVSINFFGRKADTSSIIARLSLKWDVPVIPTFYYRNESGSSILSFEKPYQTIQTGNLQNDIVLNTQMYMKKLEERIRKMPESWTLWMHNRWGSEDT